MRAPTSFAVVVRRRDGSLLVRERGMPSVQVGWRKWPLVRGVVSLVESLRLGMEAIRFSSDLYIADLEAEEQAAQGPSGRGGRDRAPRSARSWSPCCLWATVAPRRLLGQTRARRRGEARWGSWCWCWSSACSSRCPRPRPQPSAAAFTSGSRCSPLASRPSRAFFKLVIVVSYMLLLRRVPDFRRDVPVPRRRAQDHQHLRGRRGARPRQRPRPSRRCTRAAAPRSSSWSRSCRSSSSPLVGGALPRIHTGSAVADNVIFFLEKLPFLPVIVALTFEVQRILARTCTTGALTGAALAGLPRTEDHHHRAGRRTARGRPGRAAGDALPGDRRRARDRRGARRRRVPELRRARGGVPAAPGTGSGELTPVLFGRLGHGPCSPCRSSSSWRDATAIWTSCSAGPMSWATATSLPRSTRSAPTSSR